MGSTLPESMSAKDYYTLKEYLDRWAQAHQAVHSGEQRALDLQATKYQSQIESLNEQIQILRDRMNQSQNEMANLEGRLAISAALLSLVVSTIIGIAIKVFIK